MSENIKYPNISDYKIAIQDSDSFSTLKNVEVQMNGGDLHFASGNFSVVFKVKINNEFFALKCFLKAQQDRLHRLKLIEKYIKANKSKYFVDFEILENEIWINDHEFEIVKLKWIEQPTLNSILHNVIASNDLRVLNKIYKKLFLMFKWLVELHIAHGDLKHDNILINETTLEPILIDYDGFYLPDFKGENSVELGSKSYQHPLRTQNEFNEEIDFFSMFVILTSIKALFKNPELLNKYHNGQNIIFDSKDFENFEGSLIYKDLIQIYELNPFLDVWSFVDWHKYDSIIDFKNEILNTPELDPIYQDNDTGKKTRKEWFESLSDDWIFALNLLRRHENKLINFIQGGQDSNDKRIFEVVNSLKSVRISLIDCFDKKKLKIRVKEAKKINSKYFSQIISVTNLEPLEKLTKIRDIEIVHIDSSKLENFSNLNWIQSLKISNLYEIKSIEFLKKLKRLKNLELEGIGNVIDLHIIQNFNNLHSLKLNFRSYEDRLLYPKMPIRSAHIENLDFIAKLKKIQSLRLIAGFDVENVNFISELKNIKTLELNNLSRIQSFKFLNETPGLLKLKLKNLDAVKQSEFDKIEYLTKIESMEIINLVNISNINVVSNLINLENFELIDLHQKNRSVKPIMNLKNLKSLTLSQSEIDCFDIFVNLEQLSYLKLDQKVIKNLPELSKKCGSISEFSFSILYYD